MRIILLILCVLAPIPVSAQQISINALPENTPQNVVNQYIKLDNIRKSAEASGDKNTARRAQSGIDLLIENAAAIDQSLLNDMTPTQQAAYNDQITLRNETLIRGTEDILNEGTLSENTNSKLIIQERDGLVKERGDNLPTLGSNNPLTNAGKSLPKDSLLTNIVATIIESAETIVFDSLYPALGESLMGLYIVFMTLWIIFFGYKMARGMEVEPMKVVIQFMAFAFVGVVLGDGGGAFVKGWILDPLQGASLGLAGLVVTSATDINSDMPAYLGALVFLEDLFFQSIDLADLIFSTMVESASLGGKIVAALVGGFFWVYIVFNFTFLTVVYAFMFIYAILALYLFLSFAPLYLVFAAFPSTRSMAMSWLRGVINYLSIPTIAAFSLALFMGIMKVMWDDVISGVGGLDGVEVRESSGEGGAFPWYDLIGVLIVVKLSYVMALRVGEISAFLTGGLTNNLGSVIQTAAKPFAKALTAYAGLKGMAGAKAWAGGKAIGAAGLEWWRGKNQTSPIQKGGDVDFLTKG